ncbi:SNF2 family N-terminal domain-containing protein [Geopyxis carbonaria]|nr:SNF2 family N-terminal domain-containing protein [Geopyxis carbonaria]
MRTPLLDHQVLGLDWMLDHEMSPARPKGGLVADAMGLGKTIQTIATMIKNMPDETDPQVTLIVAPLALLQQWKDEILQHTKRNQFQVFINHGANKIKKLKDLKNKDVVLTTYNSIMFSCPKTKRPDDVTPGEYKEWFEDQFDRHRGIFHRMKFWRVILDEAHVIKNRRSRTSIACQRLDAEYTWALSGTPIQNSLYDIFPIFSFIGHPTAGNLDYFEAMMQSGVSDSIKAQRIQALLRSCYMRRTKNEILLGRRLITLPRKRVRMVELEFGEEERSLYMAVEQYSRDVINGYIRRGTHTKNYSNILTLLLRLRQICNHPYLILTTINNDFTANELDQALDSGVDGEKPSGLKLLLQAAQITPVGDLSECAICLGALEQPVMGRCRHLFCRACIVDVLTTLVQAGKDATCPLCRRPISEAELHTPEGFDAPTPSDADSGDWLDSVGAFMHSAKTLALQDQLAEWAANHPGDKVVLFSQFTKMLDIVERVLDNATGGVRWGYCRYDGAMGISEREESLRLFRADPATHIMLTSIKAGGVGLNLTKANLVVSLDLWWNAATELQAFDRVHRLGQTKEVFVTRFLVKSTVEERILETQEAKRALADAALGEGKADLGRLSIDKLMGLFGNLVTRNGRMQIEADYDRAQMLVRAREAGDRRAARGAAVEVLE